MTRIGTPDELLAELEAGYLTDGLPVYLPTTERVYALVEGTGQDPEENIGELEPSRRPAGILEICSNAAMAGCQPAHMPVVIAGLRALLDPESNLAAVQTTTNPATPVVVVNGPIAEQAGFNSGEGLLGPGNKANAVVGRAIHLVLQNIGGAVPGRIDRSTQGQPGKFTFCFAENEAASPWAPMHVDRGHAATSSCVTVTSGTGTTNVWDVTNNHVDLLATLVCAMSNRGSADYGSGGGSPLLLLCPEHAAVLGNAGYSRVSLQQALWEQTSLRWDDLSPAVSAQARKTRQVTKTGDSYDPPLAALTKQPADLLIAVGGGGGSHSTFMGSYGKGVAVTVEV